MTSPDTQLADVLGHDRRTRGCPVCGQTSAAQVGIRITSLNEHGQVNSESKSKTKARSLCAQHALQAWNTLLETFDTATT